MSPNAFNPALPTWALEAASLSARSSSDNDQLLQLTGAIGYYVMLAMTVNACELEAAPGAEVLKP